MTLLVVLILMVLLLCLLCLWLFATFLVVVLMLIIVFLLSFFTIGVNDLFGRHNLDLGDFHLAFFVLVVVCDPFGRDPHVDHHFLFPLF